jgi:hypothetical protein
VGELRTEHLKRHGPVVFKVPDQVDRSHPAAPELALKRVAVG